MSRNKEYILILSLLMGTILVPINSTMIAVGLSSISDFFNESIASISWIVTIYLIVMAVTQPIAGKLGDIYGNRRMYIWGISLFLLASVGCAFSPNVLLLIVFRSLQAIGGALLTPNSMAIVWHTVEKGRLAKVLGLLGMGMGLGAALGPLIGSVLIDSFGWQSIFWVNVPFLLFAFLSAIFIIPNVDTTNPVPLDIPGAIYLAISFTLFILLTHPHRPITYFMMGACLLTFSYLFVRREKRAPAPLIHFGLFHNRTFTSANLSILLSNFTMYAILLMMPLLMTSQFQLSTSQSGLVLSCFSISMSVAGWIGGHITSKFGSRKIISLSFACMTGANLLFFFLSDVRSISYLVLTLLWGGLAIGIGTPGMQTSSLESVDKSMAGIASGIFSTFRYFGSMVASTLVGLVLNSHILFMALLLASVLGIITAQGIGRRASVTPVSNTR
ncbi:MFS transporter [Aneurinibacillus aneurinilyticus]|uniref:MFS transporter n=1 Tax=Aneurinibacillus aneurinilyticus TaxID=1391 RepID=UPI0023F94332|nr:MFS transporter [Aneurinibacillus aneurinilyticus]MCI1692841.1 MFS transporter [Aneurinibacillus aneurinilyticus]